MAVNMNDIIVSVSVTDDDGIDFIGRNSLRVVVSLLEGRHRLTNCTVRFEKDGCKVSVVGGAIGIASVLKSCANDSDVTLRRDADDARRRVEELTRENAQLGITLAMLARDS